MKPIQKAKKFHILPSIGRPLRTKKRIVPKEKCGGFFVKNKHLDARKSNCYGTYIGYVPGAGGEVWWIEHEDGTIAAYMYNELTDI